MKKDAPLKGCFQPQPKILVSCRDKKGRENALAVAYCCNCSFDPPMLMVGIVPSRFSHHIIKETGCMVVNIPTKSYTKEFKYLGSVSGRDEDKLKNMHIKTANAAQVNAPLLTDCPVNIELTVVDSMLTGSHEMFACKIEKVHADEALLDEKGEIMWDKVDFI